MAISQSYHSNRAKLALELTMRDALAGMEELATCECFWFDTSCLEILSIEPPRPAANTRAAASPQHNAEILSFPDQRRRTA